MFNKIFVVIFALAVVVVSVWYTNAAEAQGIVSDGLIAFWTFDSSDIEGEIAIDVLGDNDGTISGVPRIVNGQIEEALEFDGVGSYIDLGNARDLDLPVVTAECWFKTSSGSEMRLFAPGSAFANKWFLALNDGGNIVVSRTTGENQNQQTTSSFNDGQWHHVVGISAARASDIKIYVDGELEPSNPLAEAWSLNGDCKIGAKGDAQYMFSGIIDEFKIYNRALTEAEVQQNYKATSQFIAVKPANRLAIIWGEVKERDRHKNER